VAGQRTELLGWPAIDFSTELVASPNA
jgi:hypothetical protein